MTDSAGIYGGWNSPNRNFVKDIPSTTVVLKIPDADIRFIRMAIETKEYQLPAIERLLSQLERMLPKETK